MGKKSLPLDQMVEEMLSIFDHESYGFFLLVRVNHKSFRSNAVFRKAYKHIIELPFSELPKFVNHPSRNVQDIVKKRLAGQLVSLEDFK